MDKFKKLLFLKICLFFGQASIADSNNASIELHFENLPRKSKIKHLEIHKKPEAKNNKSHVSKSKDISKKPLFAENIDQNKQIKELPNDLIAKSHPMMKELPKILPNNTPGEPKKDDKTSDQAQKPQILPKQDENVTPKVDNQHVIPANKPKLDKPIIQPKEQQIPMPVVPVILPNLDTKLENQKPSLPIVTPDTTQNNLVISLKFAEGENDIKDINKNNIDSVLEKIKSNNKKIKITAHNQTSNDPGISQIINLQRLIAIKKYLVSNLVTDDRITTNIDSKSSNESNMNQIDILYTE